MSETPEVESPEQRRVIKRYSNRKLYDTKDSRYVTLQQIGEMVRAGEEVQIIDNKTKEDKTEVTLALILSEDLKSQPRSVPLGTLRNLIQERGNKLLSSLREGPIGRLIPASEGSSPGEADAPAKPSETVVAVEEPKAEDKKGRLSGLVETSRHTLDQWQQAVDERVTAALPGIGQFRELQAEVRRLTQRVEELEKALRDRGGASGDQG
jgi:polyhydroxyalkanoate synthesis repressor PhaR